MDTAGNSEALVPTEDSDPGYQQWLAWAEGEVGGDDKLARSAAHAALAALAQGLDATSAAERALTVAGVTSCRFVDGRVVLAGERLLIQRGGVASAVPVGTLNAIEGKLETDNTVSLQLQRNGAATSEAIRGAESAENVQALLVAVQSVAPSCRIGWMRPDVMQRRQVLRDRVVDLSMQGFQVVYQNDDQAQLKKPKEFNTNLFIILLIFGIVLIELPMIIYLIVYLFKRDTVLIIRIDEWGRLSEQRVA